MVFTSYHECVLKAEIHFKTGVLSKNFCLLMLKTIECCCDLVKTAFSESLRCLSDYPKMSHLPLIWNIMSTSC